MFSSQDKTIHTKIKRALLVFLGIWLVFQTSVAQANTPKIPPWVTWDRGNQPTIHLYFFWSTSCPHCLTAKPWLEQTKKALPWLQVHDKLLTDRPENVQLYLAMGKATNTTAQYVPGFAFCRQLQAGFDGPETTGKEIIEQLRSCYAQALSVRAALRPIPKTLRKKGDPAPTTHPTSPQDPTESSTTKAPTPPKERPLHIPFLGAWRVESLSLPVLTIILGSLDAFNPCAFFVLLFLLSMLVNAGSRGRMLLIGGVFVFFSGAMYFAFMAAWLNVFLWMGELKIITFLAGIVALIVALINIKDFFWFKKGVTLSLSESSTKSLFQRIRGLLQVSKLPSLLLGTVALAIAANTYELICTSGFPMIYTRILTMRKLPTSMYYLYLLLYNVVYVLPLVVIMLVFVYTLGRRKLQEHEGRLLKLMSGLMMLGLGLLLLLAPDLLHSAMVGGGILLLAVLLTLIIGWITREKTPPPVKLA